MKNQPPSIVEAEMVATNTAPIVPNVSTEMQLVVRGKPVPPTARQIQDAFDFLLGLKMEEVAPTEGELGDVFLVYDVSLRTRGEDVYRVRNQIPMFGILTETGLPDAPTELDAALAQLARPLRTKALSWMKDRQSGIRKADTVSPGKISTYNV